MRRRTTTTKIFCLLSQHCQQFLFETSLVAPSSPETFQSPTTVRAPLTEVSVVASSTASSTAFISPSPHECKDDVQDPAVCNYPHICSNAYVQKVCRKSCGLCKFLFVFLPLITIISSSSLPCFSSVRAAICRRQLCAKMSVQALCQYLLSVYINILNLQESNTQTVQNRILPARTMASSRF